MKLRHAFGVGAACLAALASAPARAAGFDTPILYTARHQGMGGTAIASVDDASAGFHNPAGLQGVQGYGFLGDFSLILGKVRATPDKPAGNRESDTVKAPFFLLGGAYRIEEWLTLGLAAFPVASGGAEYRYNDAKGNETIDKTEIVFFEVTPMLSLNVPKDRWLPGKLAFGAGYRFSYVTFDREKGAPANPQQLDLQLSGTDFKGFRVGAQWAPIDELKLGVVYRNPVTVTTKTDSGMVFGSTATDGQLDFNLPSKLGFGSRVDLGPFSFGNDVEWAFQSQNKRPALKGVLTGASTEVPNVFEWKNGITWRTGIEYRIGKEPTIPLRLGYIFDSRVTNPRYPSAFGTPPGPTRTFTAGVGLVEPSWQVNLAVSRRIGEAYVPPEGVAPSVECRFCGVGGQYEIAMTGLYIDASVNLPK